MLQTNFWKNKYKSTFFATVQQFLSAQPILPPTLFASATTNAAFSDEKSEDSPLYRKFETKW